MYKKPEYIFFTAATLFAVSVFTLYQVSLGPLLKETGNNFDLAENIVIDGNNNTKIVPDDSQGADVSSLLNISTASGAANTIPSAKPAAATILKSVRLDLSSIPLPTDLNTYTEEVLARIKEAGGNAVYISPWSDGRANYKSASAPLNDFGNNNFLENFISKAKTKDIKVFAWFVVGKDNFPYFSHPEWFAKTRDKKNYYQEDESGIELPFASLANNDYLDYHLKLISEVNSLPLDGWVISEPLIGWGDKYDDFYTDFSPSATNKFRQRSGINTADLFNENSDYYYENNSALYGEWVNSRADIITDFVAASVKEIRKKPDRTVLITLFTEPDQAGRLIPFSLLKEWLGTDIAALAALKPDYFEIQSLFADFEYPQKPEWTADMIKQFRAALPAGPSLLVSVQGFSVTPDNFANAIRSAIKENASGVSFYAYHTLSDKHWEALKNAW